MHCSASAAVGIDSSISNLGTAEVCTKVWSVLSLTETGHKATVALNATGLGVNLDGGIILSAVGQVGQVLKNEWFLASVGSFESEFEQSGVVGGGHVNLRAAVEGDAEMTGLCDDGVVLKGTMLGAILFGEIAIIDLVILAGVVRKQREIPQRWRAAGTRVVQNTEASDGRAIQSKSTLVASAIGVCHSLGHAVGDCGAREDIATICGTNQGIDEGEGVIVNVALYRILGQGNGQPGGCYERSQGNGHDESVVALVSEQSVLEQNRDTDYFGEKIKKCKTCGRAQYLLTGTSLVLVALELETIAKGGNLAEETSLLEHNLLPFRVGSSYIDTHDGRRSRRKKKWFCSADCKQKCTIITPWASQRAGQGPLGAF